MTTPTATLRQQQAAYQEVLRTLAQATRHRYDRRPADRLYLVGTRSGPDAPWDGLCVATDDEQDRCPALIPVRWEYLPPALCVAELHQLFDEYLRREPLWIFAD